MILCVNANAAIDKTVVIENFQLNAIHRPSYELVLSGGKSSNVARAAKTLGLPAMVTGWVGGHAGNFIEAALRAEGIQTALIHTPLESRTCLSVVDPARGTLTEIYEKGQPVSGPDLQALIELYQGWLAQVEMVTLCGSLPEGVPKGFFADLSRRAREAGVPAVIDTSGEGLRLGAAEGRPWMVKCNRFELSELAGRPLDGLEEVKAFARDLAARRATQVVVTLGGEGALAVVGQQAWLGQAPRIQSVSAVGSGDAFLAGLACGLLSGQPFAEALRLGIAAGSANALQLGAGRLDLVDVNRLLAQVQVQEL